MQSVYVKPAHPWDIWSPCCLHTGRHRPLLCPSPVTAGALSHLVHTLTHRSFSLLSPALSLLRLPCIVAVSAQPQCTASNCRHTRVAHGKVKLTHLLWCLPWSLSHSSPAAIILPSPSHHSWAETGLTRAQEMHQHTSWQSCSSCAHMSNIKVPLWGYPASLQSHLCPKIHSAASQAHWISAWAAQRAVLCLSDGHKGSCTLQFLGVFKLLWGNVT